MKGLSLPDAKGSAKGLDAAPLNGLLEDIQLEIVEPLEIEGFLFLFRFPEIHPREIIVFILAGPADVDMGVMEEIPALDGVLNRLFAYIAEDGFHAYAPPGLTSCAILSSSGGRCRGVSRKKAPRPKEESAWKELKAPYPPF
jgi:hypothetical protein